MKSVLSKEKDVLKKVLDFLPDATFIIDRNGRVLAWNKAIEEMTGVRAEAMLGKSNFEYALPFYGERKPILIDLVFKSNDELEKKYSYIQRKNDVVIAETQVAKLKGKTAVLWAKASAIRDKKDEIIGAIETIRDITAIKSTENALRHSEAKLKEQKAALEQRNIDLQDILGQVEVEKNKIQENVTTNVENIILPLVKKIRLRTESKKYIHLLQRSLEELTAAFGSRISQKKFKLSPRELEICAMIREGVTGKDISRLLSHSFQTVEMHRKNIRRKLGIANKKVNLISFLKGL